MKAIRIKQFGGPEVMEFCDVAEPKVETGQALIALKAIGVNYIDIYFRTGLYRTPMPAILGLEGAGIILETGNGVKDFHAGDRVAYIGILGSYAERQAVVADRLIKLQDQISFEEGAAAMVQGMTAHYLTTSAFALKKGDYCLVHAAAGGVGLLLCQVAKNKGAIVIGTVSNDEKTKLAHAAGAHHVIIYTKQDFVSEVKRITDGKGVQVVYDGVGKATFEKGFDCLAKRGMMVLFGQSSGSVPPFDPTTLNQKGSLFLTRPGINAYTQTREELLWRANDVFSWIIKKEVVFQVNQRFSLTEAPAAHRALEARRTTGKIILVPPAH